MKRKLCQARGAVDGRGLVERGRHGLQARQQRDRDERHAAPDIGEDHADQRAFQDVAEEVDVAGDQAEMASATTRRSRTGCRRSTRTRCAESTVGTMNGISTMARSIALNGMFSFSSSAR